MNNTVNRVLGELNRLSLYDCMHNPYYAHRLAKEAGDLIQKLACNAKAPKEMEEASRVDNKKIQD